MAELSIEPGRLEPDREASDQRAPPVPEAIAPPPSHPRFPLVDGVRAIAVLCVVLVHTASIGGAFDSTVGRLLARMNIGVTIFFVISGFLLYRPFIAHRTSAAAAPPTSAYFKRRFLRIFPAYWLALAVFALLPGVTAVSGDHWWPMVALVHTLPLYDGPTCLTDPHCGLNATWSLVVELSFYLTLPLYAWVVGRALTRFADRVGMWLTLELGILAALSGLSIVLQFVVLDPVPRWFSAVVTSYVWWFALGMALALVSVALQGRSSRPRMLQRLDRRPEAWWILAAGVFAILCARLPATPILFDRGQVAGAHVGYGVVAALLLAPAVLSGAPRSVPRLVLANPVLAWLGLISYGIFLWHVAIALRLGPDGADASFAVILVGTLALAIGIAALSYYLLERPVMRLKYRKLGDLLAARPKSGAVDD